MGKVIEFVNAKQRTCEHRELSIFDGYAICTGCGLRFTYKAILLESSNEKSKILTGDDYVKKVKGVL